MKKFRSYQQADSFRYQMTPFCVFCGGKTDRMTDYRYHGVELDVREFPIPVHPLCYYKKQAGIWLTSAMLFAVLLCGAVFVESRWLNPLPYWLWALNGIAAFLAAGYWALRRSAVVEHKIARYKRAHTDYEDYYKSDRRRQAGFRNW